MKRKRNSNVVCVEYAPNAFKYMMYGAERRKAIIHHLLQDHPLYVNLEYCPKTYNDPDLQHLIKQGIIRVGRTVTRRTWRRSARATDRRSYVALV